MASLSQNRISKAIQQGTKQVLSAQGIKASTRRGNKELSFVIQSLARAPFTSLSQANAVGIALGEKIAALSQKMGRQQLDQGVIRQLWIQKDLPPVPTTAAAPTAATAKAPAPATVSPEPPEPDTTVDTVEDTATEADEMVSTAAAEPTAEPTAKPTDQSDQIAEPAAAVEAEAPGAAAEAEDTAAEADTTAVDESDETSDGAIASESSQPAVDTTAMAATAATATDSDADEPDDNDEPD